MNAPPRFPLRGADSAEHPKTALNSLASRRFSKHPPAAVVVGASTGGPQALDIVLGGIAPFIEHVPVIVVLHMPAEFTEVIASHTEKLTGVPSRSARHHEELQKGRIYFAPGDLHLGVARRGNGEILYHSEAAPENFCRPSVDFLFRTAAHCYAERLLAIILTGMGHDGLAGSRAIVEAGGAVIAQDEASSVVWGMPGSVAMAGLASAVLPIGAIAPTIRDLLSPLARRGSQR